MFTLKDESFYIDYLRFRIRWIRSMPKTADYSVHRMSFPYTLFWLVMEGPITMVIQGQEQSIAAGSLIVLPPNTTFSLLPRQGERTIRYLSLCADLKIGNSDLVTVYGLPTVSNAASSSEGYEQLVQLWLAALESFDQLGELITEEGPSPGIGPQHTYIINTGISAQFLGLQGLLYQWLQQLLTVMQDRLPKEPVRLEERVMKVCDYVRHHISRPLSLQELAEHVFLSPSHLSYLFMQTMGMPPMEYVRGVKIQTAKTLLMDSVYTIKEIAEKVGYGEQSQLSRAFHQAEGMSPSRYRQMIQNSSTL
ncbi:AraC family transcriptional regulator [Paenibacillus sp. H1-7]|uniref:helix-turn-helix domain-containing protein n=1 Tax=Paenibacillus sp. H1-7 TaxID=2282849 RepID=UPI001EF8DE6F|nr:AraC family transcriptional regulator [Paenibacillus sp. H1-7]ULL15321.1 AraC family transcriptional regulator [Paenibacillus sp. H1-7]